MLSKSVLTFYCALQLLVALVSCAFVQNDYNLPSSVKICQRDDSDYNSCITDAVQESWMTFVQGIPKLNVPVLDPLDVEMVENSVETNQFVGYMVVRDAKIYGLAKTKFLSVRPQFTDNRIHLEMDVEIPKVFIKGDYKSDGSVGSFNIGGKGHFNVSMVGLTATWSLDGRIENDRWIVEHLIVDPEIQGMKVYFSDLLNGDPMLNQAALTIANEYWPIIYKRMKPIVQKLSDPRLTDFVNRSVFSKVSVSKIFP
ncbi:circadian clock-controlled protein [Nasonia vitripennis]|uniref:Circadian clock-controlled protein n=1 Tax=Nasonia vitripennis TaxID=7425 RepID=A0A7M7J0P9_NASVI|nr:circadian clock-controlled protein [Nasonia vitripennis]